MKALYLKSRLYWLIGAVALLFVLGVFEELFFAAGILGLAVVLVLIVWDAWRLWGSDAQFTAERDVGERMSNGDHNPVTISVSSQFAYPIALEVVDEIPVQLQRRDLSWQMEIEAYGKAQWTYRIRPVRRGEYAFGSLHAFASTNLGLVARRFSFAEDVVVKVYPSYLQMKKYAFLALDQRLQEAGIKRMRRLGHTMEFEQIKEYVAGDDARTLNWKATARAGKAMVNQYRDERAQPVYCVIDKGRLMQMPFEGMTLLDYAINASLVMSYIAIRREDRAGLITFAERIDSVVPAGRRNNQMYRILETLYNQRTRFLDADFERLYSATSRHIGQRSLLLLFTNFEALSSLKRQIPYLRKLTEKHVLVVIFFRNTELHELTTHRAESLREIYHQTLAEKAEHEKETMIQLMRQHGIYAVLTTPADLTVDTINTYLNLKARGVV